MVHQVDQRQLWGQCLERDSYRTEHFKMNNNFEVGRGDRVRFWEDIWCSETPHYVLLLRSYVIAGSRETTTMEVW